MPRETLSREQIVQAAVEMLDADGLGGLSMRKLGTRLGSAATAVYWHVKNKDNLLILAVDAVWEEITLPDPDRIGWRTAATQMADGLYAMILRHPWVIPAMSTQPMYGSGKARHDDHLLAIYETAGFTGHAADQAVMTVFTYVLGNALGAASEAAWRSQLRRTGVDEQKQILEMVAHVTEIAAHYPRLRARSEAWNGEAPVTSESGREDFEAGLAVILDGLQLRLPD